MIAAMDPAALDALEKATPLNDDIFDARRPPAIVASPPGTQGMMFWYYVLASRIDDGQAWAAATRWMGDSTVTSTEANAQCVDSKIAAADADGAAVLLADVHVMGVHRSWRMHRRWSLRSRATRSRSGPAIPVPRCPHNCRRECRWRSAVQESRVRWWRRRIVPLEMPRSTARASSPPLVSVAPRW